MTAELTAEEVVTKLLTSNQILKPSNNYYFTKPVSNLGEYLINNPEEDSLEDFDIEILKEPPENERYSFIKGSWKYQ